MGIEPMSSAWKAEVLPLNYTRLVMTPKYSIPTSASAGFESLLSPGGGGRIRTYEGVSRQIYSLLPLAAWVPLRDKRAAYFDFRTRLCQCIFWAKLPSVPAIKALSHSDSRPPPRVLKAPAPVR